MILKKAFTQKTWPNLQNAVKNDNGMISVLKMMDKLPLSIR